MSNGTGLQPEFQMVPVPSQHVMAVMRFVASLDAEANVANAGVASPDGRDHATDDDLKSISQSNSKALKILTNIFDVLVKDPDEWMNLDEIASLSEWDRPTLKGVWTHVSRAMKAHYGNRSLPMETKSGSELGGDTLQYYRVTSDQAEQWKRARLVS